MSVARSSQANFLDGLGDIVGAAHVLTEAKLIEPYLTDWRGRYRGEACAVVRPASATQVAQVVALCSEQCVPIVAQGGNTSLCGGSVPDGSGRAIVLNLTRMNRIRELDLANDSITAEAGCVLATVQKAAAEADRLFPVSLAAEGSCTIGGNLSTNAGGVQVLRYGNMRDQVLGLEVVLADGRLWEGLRGLRKDNTGYDLKQLFIGAEGTLGVITAAVLKLHPRPRARVTAWVAVPDPEQAVTLLSALRSNLHDRLSAFELVSRICLDLVLKHIPGARDPLAERHAWYVLLELADTQGGAWLRTSLEQTLAAALESGLARDAVIAESEAQANALWSLREHISEAQRLEGSNVKHDVSVPVSRIAAFMARAERELASAFPGARVVAFGHLGDGNLHYNVSAPLGIAPKDFAERSAEINRVVHDLVHAHAGSISAEHGLGQMKREEILRYKTPLEMELMRSIKRTLDPHNIMNPGKVVALS